MSMYAAWRQRKPNNLASLDGNAPLLVLRTTSPGGGSFSDAIDRATKVSTRESIEQISPSGGDAAAGGRRSAFPRAIGAVVWFSLARKGDYKGFI